MPISALQREVEVFTSANDDSIYLGGANLPRLRELGLTPGDWSPYLPVDPQQIEDNNIEVHYLGLL